MHLYGLKNCDTCRKALAALKAAGVADVADLVFHDFKKEPPTADMVQSWCDALGWEALLNKRGTTWRGLDETEKEDVTAEKAVDLMVQHSSLIKRPIIQNGDRLTVGWSDAIKDSLLDV